MLGCHTAFVGEREAPESYEQYADEIWRSRSRAFLCGAFGAAVVISFATVLATVFSGNGEWAGTSGYTGKPCTATSAQARFQCTVIQDRSALTLGNLVALRKLTIPLDQADQFEVTVCGDRSAECSQPATAPDSSPAPGSTGAPHVLVGGYISAKLTSDMPGQIEPESEQVQPVISDTDAATWIWEIEPTQAGTYSASLTVTPLLGTSSTPLVAGVPYVIRLTVTESTSQHLSLAAGTVIHGSVVIISVFGATTLAGMGTWIWGRVRKRRKASAEPSAKVPAPTGPHRDAQPVPIQAHRPQHRHRRSSSSRHQRTVQPRRRRFSIRPRQTPSA